jgi:S1-C subfamily serine protease
MKGFKVLSIAAAVIGVLVMALVSAPGVSGQTPNAGRDDRQLRVFLGAGARIGISVRDLETSEAAAGGGVYVERVVPDSPAAKAGFQVADVVTRFDGEAIRSVRQFSRLVQETPSGRSVAASVRRQGKQVELSVVPETSASLRGDNLRGLDQERLRQQIEEARERIARLPFDLDFDFDFDVPRSLGRSRLGVSVHELTPQLAAFFGAKDGVLIAAVADDTPAARAGLRAGDVIVSVNTQTVATSGDLVRALRNAGADAKVTIAIVRDKKEMSVEAQLDSAGFRPGRRGVNYRI